MSSKKQPQIDNNTIIQGDVILRRVSSLPDAAKPADTSGIKILQQSEVTGHHHYFTSDSTVRLYETGELQDPRGTITPDTGKYLIVDNVVHLYHGVPQKDGKAPATHTGDHAPVSIPEGIWEVIITQQYDYDSNEVVRVVD